MVKVGISVVCTAEGPEYEQTGLRQRLWACLQIALGVLVNLGPQHKGLRAADALLEPCPVLPATQKYTHDAVTWY